MVSCVLKVGGSLGKDACLPKLGTALAAMAVRHRMLVVPGGGIFADAVRESYKRYSLGDSAAHWMAILGMEQYGLLLADLIPDARTVCSLEGAAMVAEAGKVPVLLPYELLRQADPLPHSWDVTSDSIGAWIARQAGASSYVLLKNQDGLYAADPGESPEEPLLASLFLEQLTTCKGVDPYLQRVLSKSGTPCWVLNGKHPKRLAELLDTGRCTGTFVHATPP